MHPRYLPSGGLVVWQCFIKIHLNAPHQILQALNQIRVDGLEPIGKERALGLLRMDQG